MLSRSIAIISLTVLYVLTLSYALGHLPIGDIPIWFEELFSKSWYATSIWLKIRHILTVSLIGVAIAMIIQIDKKTALINAFLIGVLSLLWGLIYRVLTIGTDIYPNFTWVEITDYLTIMLAIPLATILIKRIRR